MLSTPRKFSLILLCFSALVLLSSCAKDYDHLSEIPLTAVTSEKLEPWDKPFTALWVDPKVKERRIFNSKIFIRPLSLAYLTPPLDEDASRKKWGEKLAIYFDQQLAEKISQTPTANERITASLSNAQYIIEPSLLRLQRTRYGLNFISMGASLFVPYISYAFSPFTYGDMVLVLKISDKNSKKTYAVIADYKRDAPSVFGSIRDFTAYGHHYKTIDMWTDKISHMLSLSPGEEVEKAKWITINPF